MSFFYLCVRVFSFLRIFFDVIDTLYWIRTPQTCFLFLITMLSIERIFILFLLRKDDLYFVGGGGEESNSDLSDWTEVEGLGRDLALASRCDHTVVSRGHTAMWAAHLSGGEYYTGLEVN